MPAQMQCLIDATLELATRLCTAQSATACNAGMGAAADAIAAARVGGELRSHGVDDKIAQWCWLCALWSHCAGRLQWGGVLYAPTRMRELLVPLMPLVMSTVVHPGCLCAWAADLQRIVKAVMHGVWVLSAVLSGGEAPRSAALSAAAVRARRARWRCPPW